MTDPEFGEPDSFEKALVGVNAKTGPYLMARFWSGGRRRIVWKDGYESYCYNVMSRTYGGEVFFDNVEKDGWPFFGKWCFGLGGFANALAVGRFCGLIGGKFLLEGALGGLGEAGASSWLRGGDDFFLLRLPCTVVSDCSHQYGQGNLPAIL